MQRQLASLLEFDTPVFGKIERGDQYSVKVYSSDGYLKPSRIQNTNDMTDFASIDFETANHEPSSICSVGVVIVRKGDVVGKYYSLVCPEPEYYSYRNTRVHGLTLEDTAEAPLFPDVWKTIAPKIEGLTLVAHNSTFDEGCLRAAFKTYNMDYPDYKFLCTCRASRRRFGRTLPNHQLQTVAAVCGYDLLDHHHALADAEACAAIALQLL